MAEAQRAAAMWRESRAEGPARQAAGLRQASHGRGVRRRGRGVRAGQSPAGASPPAGGVRHRGADGRDRRRRRPAGAAWPGDHGGSRPHASRPAAAALLRRYVHRGSGRVGHGRRGGLRPHARRDRGGGHRRRGRRLRQAGLRRPAERGALHRLDPGIGKRQLPAAGGRPDRLCNRHHQARCGHSRWWRWPSCCWPARYGRRSWPSRRRPRSRPRRCGFRK